VRQCAARPSARRWRDCSIDKGAPMTVAENPRVRLFFAALPDAATRGRIAAVADALMLGPGARPVPCGNYHVTLAFVGEIAAPLLPTLLKIGSAQRIPSFSLRFAAYEYWPKPEVVVAAARAIPPALGQLWQQLHRELAAHQWALDPKRLRPHVTLARKVSQAPVLQAMSSIDWPVREFCLMRSDTSGVQSAYTVVDTWSLLYDAAET
jgi:RNA 2',3'-cyclic 3'-phosphodiesterase